MIKLIELLQQKRKEKKNKSAPFAALWLLLALSPVIGAENKSGWILAGAAVGCLWLPIVGMGAAGQVVVGAIACGTNQPKGKASG